ncbi:MBL fold metallo-hydrolase [Mesobacillus sp. LC4]
MENQFFTCTEIHKGVYAAVVKDGLGALGNAGFVDLGDGILIFDTFMVPEAASELRRVAEEQTGKPVKYVVNSHYHGDHTNGNVVFKDAVIISTALTRQKMQESYENRDIPAMKAGMDSYFAQLEERIAKEQNEQLRIALEYDLSDKRKYAESLDLIEEVLPTVLFEDKLVLQGSERTVELYHFGGGHTESDLFMYLPDEQVLFAGDLVFVNNHAWMGHGNPHEWLTILEKMQKFAVSSIVPGHGNAGSHEDLQNTKEYIEDMIHFVSEMNQKGKLVEELMAEHMLEKYSKMDSPHVYEWNLNFLYGYLSQREVSHS